MARARTVLEQRRAWCKKCQKYEASSTAGRHNRQLATEQAFLDGVAIHPAIILQPFPPIAAVPAPAPSLPLPFDYFLPANPIVSYTPPLLPLDSQPHGQGPDDGGWEDAGAGAVPLERPSSPASEAAADLERFHVYDPGDDDEQHEHPVGTTSTDPHILHPPPSVPPPVPTILPPPHPPPLPSPSPPPPLPPPHFPPPGSWPPPTAIPLPNDIYRALHLPPRLGEGIQVEAGRLRNRDGIQIDADSLEFRAIKAYKLQMETNTGANTYAKWLYTFPELDIPSLKVLRRQMERLSGLEPIWYDCCRNVCICFAGPFANLAFCPTCKMSRRNEYGVAYNRFQYIPLTPQLTSLFAGKTSASAMRYRSRHHLEIQTDAHGTIADVYDSSHYQSLLTKHVVVNGHTLDHTFFDQPTDVCLSKYTDGFQLWKRSKKTSWPLLFTNDNLDATIRCHDDNLICVGLIPGPNKPKNFESFYYVVIEELLILAIGIRIYDAYTSKMITLRVYAIFGCGDMPACAVAFLQGKIPGAKHPCRACHIEGVRIIGTRNMSHYLPLIRPTGYPTSPYTIENLPPLRNHAEYLLQAHAIDSAHTVAEHKRLSVLYGINGTPITSRLPGVAFPASYPFDLMHLMYNTLKNYLLLFTGNFKGLDAGAEDYILSKEDQAGIALATLGANKTIPSSFGRTIPDPINERHFFTAEAYVVWSTLYAPILFRRRFSDPKYYRHFRDFISIIERVMDNVSTSESRAKLRQDIKQWYADYEEIFYQDDPSRLVVCLNTVHAWLHVVDFIESTGPGPSFWCWGGERLCGRFARAITSRKHPYASLDRRALERATLAVIRNTYDLQEVLPRYSQMHKNANRPTFAHPDYDRITLLHPRKVLSYTRDRLPALKLRIAAHLCTILEVPADVIKRHLGQTFEQYGRVQIKDEGTVHASIGSSALADGRRDATFIQYELLVDALARYHKLPPRFGAVDHYGQLQRIIVIDLPASEALGLEEPETFILFDIHVCSVTEDEFGFYEYTQMGRHEVIDGSTIRAGVGRIYDRGKWVMVKRHGVLQHSDFNLGD